MGAGGFENDRRESGSGETSIIPSPTVVNNLTIHIFLPSFIPTSRKQYRHTSITIRYPVIRIAGEIHKSFFTSNNMVFATNLIIQDVFVILTKQFHRPRVKSVGMKPILTTKRFMKIKEDDGE